jgi:ABC-2 type transport system permease protein
MKESVLLFTRALLARAYPRVIGLWREPSWMLQETLLPFLSVAAFAYVYKAMNTPREYVAFVILGGAMTAFWLNVLWAMGAQLYWERESGNLELFIIAPASLTAILAGMAVGGMVMTLVRALAILVTGWLLFVDVPVEPSSWPGLLGIFLLTLLALYGLGMLFASLFLVWGRPAWHIVNLLQEPVYLLSGLNYPVRTLGKVAATVAAVLPMTLGIDAMRQILFGSASANPLLPVWVEVLLLVVLAVLFLVLARLALGYLERVARKEGRLTVRWE